MLIDEPLVQRASRDPILAMIGSLNGNVVDTAHIRTGVYQIGHFGSSDFMRGLYEQYPDLNTSIDEPYMGCYGVCDSVDDILAKCPLIENDPDRQFVICLTQVRRATDNKGKGGGWRWHKWGEYIGKREPTTEYLDDEPEIDSVYVYHVYERIVNDGI